MNKIALIIRVDVDDWKTERAIISSYVHIFLIRMNTTRQYSTKINNYKMFPVSDPGFP